MKLTLTRYGWGVAIALVASGVSIRGLAQAPDDPFLDHNERGEVVHVLPAPALLHNPHFSGPTDAPNDGLSVYAASYGSGKLTDHGGPEIPNAAFRAIYWNSGVANSTATSGGYTTISSQLTAFISYFGNDNNYSGSPTDDYSIVQQYGSRNPIASGIQALGYRVDTQAATSRITDRSIQTYLSNLFGSGLEQPSATTIYGVYFPHGMRVALQGGSSCTSFCGYHSHFTYGSTVIKYAVFPFPDCAGCSLSGKSVADMLTIVTSHEIREAATDALGTAWFDSQGYEADDKCAWHNLYQMSGTSLWVQPEYSNGGTKNGTSYPGPGCVVAR